MKILAEVSNKEVFIDYYGDIIREENVSEDSVSYGAADYLVFGLIFVFEASLAGFTWDMVKTQIYPTLERIFKKKRKNDFISIYLEDNEERYSIEIPADNKSLELEIPEKLKLKIRR